jgi:succinate-semialdehyde dehydrogenase/glutarate-semialdehyde dehydrogenase
MSFVDEFEAIDIANRTKAGLAAYFYTQNPSRIAKVTKALKVGMVGVNESLISTEVAPFGGIKDSGYGREGSYLGLQDYLQTKYMCIGQLGT